MFEIKHKDYLGRIGNIPTPHGIIETPQILPVINPFKQILSPSEMVSLGAEAFITNSYLIYRDEDLRMKAVKNGLHNIIGFSGPLMTDSGAFQLMKYGEVSINNELITHFQEEIGSDIGVFLDVPVKKGNYEGVKESVDITIQRALEHIECRNPESKTLWAGPIQGAPYEDLVQKSGKNLGKMDFDLHPIGSVVPLLESYQYLDIIKAILMTKRTVPMNKPIHLFGAGHPLIMPVAVLLGIDIFDSASYVLYAHKDRYITETATLYLKDLQYLPCSCEVCANITARELKRLDKPTRLKKLSKHNLIKCLEEIKRIKQAIIDGRLLDHCISRTMGHPKLSSTLKYYLSNETSLFVENYDPISKKKARFFSHIQQVNEPIILRYQRNLIQRFHKYSDTLYISSIHPRIKSTEKAQVIFLSSIFGIIPWEIKSVYPLTQHSGINFQNTEEIIAFQTEFLKKYLDQFDTILINPSLKNDLPLLEQFSREKLAKNNRIGDEQIIRAILDYQYGFNLNQAIGDLTVDRSHKTTIIRRFKSENKLLGTIRASDFVIVPTQDLSMIIKNNFPPINHRVIIADEDVISIVKTGKDVFAKFVDQVDPNIRAGNEIIIVDNEDNYLGHGRAILSAKEMLDFTRGVAVKIR